MRGTTLKRHSLWRFVFATGLVACAQEAPMERAVSETRVAPPLITSQAVGSLEGAFAVSADGAATYSLPLTVPPGRAGVAPALALSYSSNGGDGPLGAGWSLSGLSRVDRCSNTARDGVVRPVEGSARDRFCLDGARLVEVGASALCAGGVEYRAQEDNFARVVACEPDADGPTRFVVYAPSGRVSTYGGAASSRVEGPAIGGGRHRLSWLVDRVEDRVGNYLSVTWGNAVAGSRVETWLARIDYTGFGVAVAPARRVVFEYETRPDPLFAHVAGIELATTRRLVRVRMEAPSPAEQPIPYVRRYDLRYDLGALSGRSRLAGVKVCDHAGVCLPETVFGYTTSATPSFVRATEIPNVRAGSKDVLAATDINGDGFDDVLYRDTGGRTNPSQDVLSVRFGSAAGTLGAAVTQTNISRPADITRVRAYDFSGDGAVDLIAEGPSTMYYRANYGVQTGFLPGSITLPMSLLAGASAAVADFGGDLVGEAHDGFSVQSPGGVPWSIASTEGYTALGRSLAEVSDLMDRRRVVDLDGDRVPEVLIPYKRYRTYGGVSTLTGIGFDVMRVTDLTPPGATERSSTNLELSASVDPETGAETYGSLDGTMFVDVNGDGLVDLLDVCGDMSVRINWGGGHFAAPVPSLAPGVTVTGLCRNGPTPTPNGVVAVDLNQDGRNDLLLLGKTQSQTERARLLTWTAAGYTLSTISSLTLTNPSDANGFDAGASTVLDVNGDGLLDVLQLDPSKNSLVLHRQSAARVDRLERVTNGLGAIEAQLTYATLPQSGYSRPQLGCTATTRCYTGPNLVVTTERRNVLTSTATAPATATTEVMFTHAYYGGRVDARGEGWLGFERHDVTNAITGEVREFYYDQSESTLNGVVRHPRRGRLVREVTRVGTIGVETSTTWTTSWGTFDGTAANFATWFSYPSRVTEYHWDTSVTPAALRTTVTDRTVDRFGNETRVVVDRGGGFVTTTTRAVTNDLSAWLIGLVTAEQVTSAVGAQSATREVAYAYEPDGTGRVRDTIREPNGGADAKRCTRVAARDTFGNVTRVELTPGGCDATAETRASQTTYDAEGLFATSVTNALGHTARTETHPGLGVVYRSADVNGVVTAWQFDGFGRVRREDRPDDTYTETSYANSTTYPMIVTETRSDGARVTSSRDRLGRTVRASTLAFDGRTVNLDTTYDRAGRVTQVTRPTFSGSTAYVAARTSYDAAGRVTAVCQHDATRCKRITYAGLTVDEVDEDGKRTTRVTSAQGLLASSSIYPAGSALTTTFAYGPFDNRVTVVDARGNQVSTTYDALGRRTRLDDADLGYVETVYNAFDEVVRETTPPGLEGDGPVVKTLGYDRLGRLVSRVAPDGTDTFVYDTASGAGLGRLASQTRASSDRHYDIRDTVTQRYAYDAIGRPTTQRWEVNAEVFELGYGYDAQGRLARLTYPEVPGVGRLVTEQLFNARGYASSIRESVPSPLCATGQCPGGVALTTLATVNTMDAASHVTKETLGNALVTTRTFDAARGYLTRETAKKGNAAAVHDVGYTYDANGNLRTRTDHRAALTETFTYDGANRLATEQVGARAAVTHLYDALGNWIGQSDGELDYRFGERGFGPHALTSACYRANPANCPYQPTLDPRGNMITGGGLTHYASMRHTSFNKPSYVERSVSAWADSAEVIAYDAAHTRVRRVTRRGDMGPWSEHVYVGGVYERRTSPTAVEHVLTVGALGQMVWRVSTSAAPQGGMRYFGLAPNPATGARSRSSWRGLQARPA